MHTTEVARIARSHAAMIRSQGPDPKGLKMRRHAFHHHQDGTTTLSASGFLLPESLKDSLPLLTKLRQLTGRSEGAVLLTAASVVECFLAVRRNAAENSIPDQLVLPELIPEARIDVLVEGVSRADGCDSNPRWLDARLLALVNVSSAASALEKLVRKNGLSENGSWDVGWSLTPLNSDPSFSADVLNDEVLSGASKCLTQKMTSTTRIAFLEVLAMDNKCLSHVTRALPQKGSSLLVMGSPFGILSPSSFLNSISVGTVANFCPTDSYSPLLLADIRCLPGMEGSPVYDECGCLVGILSRPLRQKGCTVEIQLVITWDAIIEACCLRSNEGYRSAETYENCSGSRQNARSANSELTDEISPRYPPIYLYSPRNLQSPLEMAIASVVLVAVGDGGWASGIILNKNGLVLANAHLLEPWRYGKGSSLSITSKLANQPPFERSGQQPLQANGQGRKQSSQSLLDTSQNIVGNVQYNRSQDSRYRTHQHLKVRLNHSKPWVWSDARVVFTSQGPMDIALLQLEDISHIPVPINVDHIPPVPGSKVHVIGHGPFGPRSDAYPYVSTGVISRVVMGLRSLEVFLHSSLLEAGESLPIMIETTAAVYPGMSGGAIVNSDGRMVGLVTSNTRHGGGVILPEINFSIPCAPLESIFKYSAEPNPSFLKVYDKPDAFLSSVWALRAPLPCEPQPPPESKNKAAKGSRFAEFLAKMQAENPPPAQAKQLDIRGKHPSRKLLDSKM